MGGGGMAVISFSSKNIFTVSFLNFKMGSLVFLIGLILPAALLP